MFLKMLSGFTKDNQNKLPNYIPTTRTELKKARQYLILASLPFRDIREREVLDAFEAVNDRIEATM